MEKGVEKYSSSEELITKSYTLLQDVLSDFQTLKINKNVEFSLLSNPLVFYSEIDNDFYLRYEGYNLSKKEDVIMLNRSEFTLVNDLKYSVNKGYTISLTREIVIAIEKSINDKCGNINFLENTLTKAPEEETMHVLNIALDFNNAYFHLTRI